MSGEQWLCIILLLEHQALCTYKQSPPPLVLPESLLRSCRWVVRPVSCTAVSAISEWSQVSVITITLQSDIKLFFANCKSISSILLTRDLALERNMLGSGGLFGCFYSLASSPALQPRFCFLSLRHLHCLTELTTIQGQPSGLAMSMGMLFALWKSWVITPLICNP